MDPFLGEIRMFAGTFAPRGWAFCQGQLLSIAQNTALFSLLGTFYGGDGRSTFALPNLTARAPVGQGQSPGGSSYQLGQVGGEAAHTLLTGEMPAHFHNLSGDNANADLNTPVNNLVGKGQNRPDFRYGVPGTVVAMASNAVVPSGNSVPHENRQPFLQLSFIIAIQGIFPQRQ